jgi:AcrR family transcriptional regulator
MQPSSLPVVEPELQQATIIVLRERGWEGLTLERVAEVAGRARSTLWRQGLTRDVLIESLVGTLAADFHAALYPVLTSAGSGRERLQRGLEALCDLVERHLPLMLANDEAFHQNTGPSQPPNYLQPFILFLREGAEDGSLTPRKDIVAAADIAFNAVAWTYVHLRGRHEWPVERARALVVALVLNGIDSDEPQLDSQPRRRPSRKERT